MIFEKSSDNIRSKGGSSLHVVPDWMILINLSRNSYLVSGFVISLRFITQSAGFAAKKAIILFSSGIKVDNINQISRLKH